VCVCVCVSNKMKCLFILNFDKKTKIEEIPFFLFQAQKMKKKIFFIFLAFASTVISEFLLFFYFYFAMSVRVWKKNTFCFVFFLSLFKRYLKLNFSFIKHTLIHIHACKTTKTISAHLSSLLFFFLFLIFCHFSLRRTLIKLHAQIKKPEREWSGVYLFFCV
jgi:hypothetical protein